MLRYSQILACLIAIAMWTSSAFAQSRLLKVDDLHMQIGDNATTKKIYTAPPGPSLSLDLTGYKFSLWPKEEPGPDTIEIIISDREQFYIPISAGQTRYVLSSENLRAREGIGSFKGFVVGQRVLVAIGKKRRDSIKNEDILRTHWLGIVDIK